jgi:hypothetical protein
MAVDGKGHDAVIEKKGMHRAGGPVVDAVDAGVAEAGLEAGCVFSEVMQQSRQAGFGGGFGAHRGGEFRG